MSCDSLHAWFNIKSRFIAMVSFLIDLYPYDVIYVNKHSAQCIVGLFRGDAPPLLLTIEAFNHYHLNTLII